MCPKFENLLKLLHQYFFYERECGIVITVRINFYIIKNKRNLGVLKE
jgi:hypothetical protein